MDTYETLSKTAAMYANECGKLRGEIERLQKLIGVDELDEIKSLLPDDSPCKHEQTGCSLYDDIGDIIRQRDGLQATHDAIFGELYKAGFHGGTVVDKVKAIIARNHELQATAADGLQVKLASALAHRGCCGTEHDPLNGKLHGYCVVCGVPWPCDTAASFMTTPKP